MHYFASRLQVFRVSMLTSLDGMCCLCILELSEQHFKDNLTLKKHDDSKRQMATVVQFCGIQCNENQDKKQRMKTWKGPFCESHGINMYGITLQTTLNIIHNTWYQLAMIVITFNKCIKDIHHSSYYCTKNNISHYDTKKTCPYLMHGQRYIKHLFHGNILIILCNQKGSTGHYLWGNILWDNLCS